MAVFNPYPIAGVSYRYVVTFYRAVAAGTGYGEGDILRQTAQMNEATGATTGVEAWYNVDQDAALATAPAGADIEGMDFDRIALSAAGLTVSNAAAGVGLPAIPANANYAEIHIWNADVVFTLDGTAPTTMGTGFRQANGQTLELESADEINKFKALRLGGVDSVLWVQYYRVLGGQNGVSLMASAAL